MAQTARKRLLTMLSNDQIARVALQLAPQAYDEIVCLVLAPERVDYLVNLARLNRWLDKLLDAAVWESCLSRHIDGQLASANPAHRLLNCSPSTTPVFVNTNPYEVLDLTIQTDFDIVNNGGIGNDESPGNISYIDPQSGSPVTVNCTVEARGNSRRDCGWRPLRFNFGSDPGGTIFTGTGRFIDFVTHCGYRPGQWSGLAGADEVEHDRRLHQEFTFYQVLRAFGGMTLETRLASTTYKDQAGNTLETRFGFVRERKSRAPLRCGMQRQEQDEGDPFRTPNPTSLFQAEFHHKLIFHHDYFFPNSEHNVVRMTDGNEDFYFPYDFDLSGVIAPDYFKNQGWSVQQNADELLNWLRQQNSELARTQVAEVLSMEDEIREIIGNTTADALGQSELDEWLQTHMRRLKDFMCGWSPNVRIRNQKSKAPSALASHGGFLHIVHLGDSSNNLWHSTWDGNSWSPNVKIPKQKSKSHPALATHCGELHMVHAGNSSNNIWHSTWDGSEWSENEKIPGQKSKAPSALASYGGLLHLVHIGNSSNDIWHSNWDGRTWSPNVRIPNQQSKSEPTLAVHDGLLHMVHAGNSSNNIWHSVWDGNGWSPNQKIPKQKSKAPSVMASHGGLLHLLHIGDSSNRIWHSTWDGNSWSPNERIHGQSSKSHPALAYHGGDLHMVHAGNSSNNIWHSIWCPCD